MIEASIAMFVFIAIIFIVFLCWPRKNLHDKTVDAIQDDVMMGVITLAKRDLTPKQMPKFIESFNKSLATGEMSLAEAYRRGFEYARSVEEEKA